MKENFYYIAYSFIEEETSANQIQTKNTFLNLGNIVPNIVGIFLGNRRNLFWKIRREENKYFIDKTNFKTGIIEKYLKIGIVRKNLFPYFFARRCTKILKKDKEPKNIYIRQGEVDEFLFYLERLDELNIKKIVFELHNLNFRVINFYQRNFEKKYSQKKYTEFFALLQTNSKRAGLVTLTKNLADIIKSEFDYEGKIKVIPDAHNLPDMEPKKINFKKDKIEIIYTGLSFFNKGIEEAVLALEFLPDNFYLRLAGGRDAEREKLSKKYQRFINGEKLILEPPVPYSEIPEKLRKADIAILPTPSEGMRDFTSPLKLFDYMASGLPIVASNTKIFKEILSSESALFFKENDSKDMAEKIIYLSQNEASAKKIGRQTFKDSQKYTYKKRAEKIYNLFDNGQK